MLRPRLIGMYFALVGLPLLALTGVLSYGRRLRAPVSVSGHWVVRTDATAIPAVTGMTLTQSGSSVSVRFDDAQHTALSGEIHEEHLFVPAGPKTLDVILTRQESEIHLNGTYAGHPFTAVRLKSLGHGA